MLAAYPLTIEERRAILIDNPKRLWGFPHSIDAQNSEGLSDE